jgi:hypothetical protein
MSALAIGGVVFACVFGGAVLGMLLRGIVPTHHLSSDSKDVVKLGMGLIATMSALVLGLLIASAKTSHDAQRNELVQVSASVIELDRVLAHYGPEAKPAREQLRRAVLRTLDRAWPENGSRARPAELALAAGGAGFYDEIQKFAPQNDAQRSLEAEALRMGSEIGRTRWILFEQRERTIPTPFMVMMVFWLTVLFTSFGLFAPPNTTIVATLLVCALSVSGAIYLVVELDQPFEGLMRLSSVPLQAALGQLGQ